MCIYNIECIYTLNTYLILCISIRHLGKYTLFSMKAENLTFLFSIRSIFNKAT